MSFNFSKAAAKTAVIIRTYNNKHIRKKVTFFLKLGFGRVIVVIKNSVDQGSTRGWLKSVRNPNLQIIELGDGYNWSPALNVGTQAVLYANKFANAGFTHVLNVSVESQFQKDHLASMLEQVNQNPKYGVVGTTFQGILDGNKVSTGRSYRHPRNTGMLVSLEALVSVYLFNPMCDALGGMEDIEFLLKLLVIGEHSYCMLDMQVPLILGEHYNQETKEIRECQAMDKIMSHLRALCSNDGPEIDRVEAAISEMKLEE